MAKGHNCVFSNQGLYFHQRLHHIHDSLPAINSQSLFETTTGCLNTYSTQTVAYSQRCFEQKTDECYLLFTNIIRSSVLVHRPDEL